MGQPLYLSQVGSALAILGLPICIELRTFRSCSLQKIRGHDPLLSFCPLSSQTLLNFAHFAPNRLFLNLIDRIGWADRLHYTRPVRLTCALYSRTNYFYYEAFLVPTATFNETQVAGPKYCARNLVLLFISRGSVLPRHFRKLHHIWPQHTNLVCRC